MGKEKCSWSECPGKGMAGLSLSHVRRNAGLKDKELGSGILL